MPDTCVVVLYSPTACVCSPITIMYTHEMKHIFPCMRSKSRWQTDCAKNQPHLCVMRKKVYDGHNIRYKTFACMCSVRSECLHDTHANEGTHIMHASMHTARTLHDRLTSMGSTSWQPLHVYKKKSKTHVSDLCCTAHGNLAEDQDRASVTYIKCCARTRRQASK
jgi:hypothetical protein